jgi:UDP-2-acetamido-3-amino-2,3-dideoxy-glucuronate N-acetyltransferase
MADPAVRVGVLGCGYWGRNLVRNLVDLGALAAICDERPAALDEVRERYPRLPATTSADAVFADASIDAVVIATPARTHAALARRALEAGKDVFVEKPLALTADEGQALVDLARARGRLLMVGHVLEYHPATVRLRQLVRDGTLGKIRYVYSTRLNLGRIRTEESALWSFAPHDVHVMLRLLAEEPSEVACSGGSYLQERVADVTMTVLSFASGVRGHIFVSWLHPFKEQKLVVVGDRKMAVFDDTLPTGKLQLFPHRVDWVDHRPVTVKADAQIVPVDDVEPLREECAHFLRCVASRAKPLTDGASGVTVLKILEACQASLDSGGAVIKLSAPPAAAPPSRPYFAHETAVVDPGADVGEGTRIWHFSHVMGEARIGRGCSLGQNVFVGRGVTIGNNVKIQNNVSVYEGVVLEDDVFCGPSMVFTNVHHPRSHVSRKSEFRVTRVRRGATIGANATVICGHTIGCYAFVGAGAVVTRDVPDYALVVGSPARLMGWVCQCGVRLQFEGERAICGACGLDYGSGAGGIRPLA